MHAHKHTHTHTHTQNERQREDLLEFLENFLKQSTFALFLVPLLANAFVSDPSDFVLMRCFICAEKREFLLQDAWAELRGLKCYFRDSHTRKNEA